MGIRGDYEDVRSLVWICGYAVWVSCGHCMDMKKRYVDVVGCEAACMGVS